MPKTDLLSLSDRDTLRALLRGAFGLALALTLAGCSDGAEAPATPGTPAPSDHGTPSDPGHSGTGAVDASSPKPPPVTGDDAGPVVDPPAPAHCDPGLPSSLADLEDRVVGRTKSSKTPMGTNFENAAKHTLTSAERTFLSDATKSPAVPSSLSSLHLRAFPVTLYPTGTPAPADINQHAIGDCDGDTAMASMAYMNPAFVKGIIEDHHDGTFTVAMYDPTGHPLAVGVDSKFLADSGNGLAAVSGKNGVADWATVLEKAVMKYNEVFAFIGDIEGIGSEHLTPLFTGDGNSLAFDRGTLAPDELTRVVKDSLAAGKFISGGFGKETPLGKVQSITAHGYAVFVPANAATMVSMRNPWGMSPFANGGGYDPSADGVLDIPKSKAWADDIDVRIIDSGAACSHGTTAPYAPDAAQLVTKDLRVTERHLRTAR